MIIKYGDIELLEWNLPTPPSVWRRTALIDTRPVSMVELFSGGTGKPWFYRGLAHLNGLFSFCSHDVEVLKQETDAFLLRMAKLRAFT